MHNAKNFPFFALIINGMLLFIIVSGTSFLMKFLYDNSAEKAFCISTDYLFYNFSIVLLDYMGGVLCCLLIVSFDSYSHRVLFTLFIKSFCVNIDGY